MTNPALTTLVAQMVATVSKLETLVEREDWEEARAVTAALVAQSDRLDYDVWIEQLANYCEHRREAKLSPVSEHKLER